ncbi:MAG: DMT family transporter [Parcubacteria group bacterium]|jgi:drug/metabolite transporter (DMT)-like permease
MKNLFIQLNEEKKGEIIIFVEAVLWSLFPVVAILSFKTISPLLSLAWSTLFMTLFFGVILFFKKGWQDLRNREVLKDILLATLILGIIYYLFYFIGLRYTTAGNASLIAQTEIFFSFLFFNIWHKKYISLEHIAGAILMLFGAGIVLYPNVNNFQIGDLMILTASFIAPLGNFFQRRARRKVKSEAILFVRSLISMPVIFILAYFAKVNFASINFDKTFLLLIINGIFLIGLSKLLWVEGIYRINVMKANALNSIAPLSTLLFAWMLIGDIPTKFQLLSFVPMFFGVILLSMNKKRIVFKL